MRKKNNRKGYIFILLGALLFAAVGYSIFTDVLNISGTATATGEFKLEFNAATVGTQTHSTEATATISVDKKTLTLAAPKLAMPGATVTYNVTIKNVGTLAALLKNINITGNTDPDIEVKITPAFVADSTIEAAATYDFTITVTWLTTSTTGNKSLDYTVTLNYEQAS